MSGSQVWVLICIIVDRQNIKRTVKMNQTLHFYGIYWTMLILIKYAHKMHIKTKRSQE